MSEPERPTMRIESPCPAALRDDPAFRPEVIFAPLARAQARLTFPRCQVQCVVPQTTWSALPGRPEQLRIVTHWQVIPEPQP